VVFAVKRAVEADPAAGIHLGGHPPIYLWHNKDPDEATRLSVFYVFNERYVILESIQIGKNARAPGPRDPRLM
jgi:hypothetical protein